MKSVGPPPQPAAVEAAATAESAAIKPSPVGATTVEPAATKAALAHPSAVKAPAATKATLAHTSAVEAPTTAEAAAVKATPFEAFAPTRSAVIIVVVVIVAAAAALSVGNRGQEQDPNDCTKELWPVIHRL